LEIKKKVLTFAVPKERDKKTNETEAISGSKTEGLTNGNEGKEIRKNKIELAIAMMVKHIKAEP